MQVVEINNGNANKLFEYWNLIGSDIPYFFDTSYDKFIDCLFNDHFNEIEIFRENKVDVIINDKEVLGFVQYGIPNFHYTQNGELIEHPNIGVIRNLYFDSTQKELGKQLLERALEFFKNKHIIDLFAFYHAMGMSCNANHGKLHEDFDYIDRLLHNNGFIVEHENIYYELEMKTSKLDTSDDTGIIIHEINLSKLKFELTFRNESIGEAEVKFLNNFTDEGRKDTVYLVWIGVNNEIRGRGIGTIFLKNIINYCLDRGYTYMHTDTALNNKVAQMFYARNGFINKGITRSYIFNVKT